MAYRLRASYYFFIFLGICIGLAAIKSGSNAELILLYMLYHGAFATIAGIITWGLFQHPFPIIINMVMIWPATIAATLPYFTMEAGSAKALAVILVALFGVLAGGLLLPYLGTKLVRRSTKKA